MEIINKRDKIRYELLVKMYELTEGSTRQPLHFNHLGTELGFDNIETENAYYYFIDEGLIEPYGAGYTALLTHKGIKKVESSFRKITIDATPFNSIETYQLKEFLNSLKEKLTELQLGQEIIFNKIDETFEQSKIQTKQDWKDYLLEQIRDWSINKVIDDSVKMIMVKMIDSSL